MKYSLKPCFTICLGAPPPMSMSAASPSYTAARLSVVQSPFADEPAAGEVGDLLHEVDLAHHESDLSARVVLARAVGDPDEPLERHPRLAGVRHAHVVGAPGDAAGEVRDLHDRLAVEAAADVPVEHLR
ncbi:MAG: hypothetical protein ACYTGM_18295, partial [Planctomycetota bacterium]